MDDRGHMSRKFALLDELLNDVYVNQAVLCGVADKVRRVLTLEVFFNGVLPKFAHLDHAAIGVAQMLLRTVDNGSLADLRCGILPVDGCHIVLFTGASHERSGLGPVFLVFGPWRTIKLRIKTKGEGARVEVIYGHSPCDVHH